MGKQDSALKQVGELFGRIGWDRRLVELEEHEVIAMMVIIKEIEGLEDVYAEEYLTELFNRYNPPAKAAAEVPF